MCSQSVVVLGNPHEFLEEFFTIVDTDAAVPATAAVAVRPSTKVIAATSPKDKKN